MELLDGQMLKHVIRGKPVVVEEVLDLGVQIADALDFQGKASILWDKFGTSPRQAINRGLMNHFGGVGSDTGNRTRICALRGHRPNP